MRSTTARLAQLALVALLSGALLLSGCGDSGSNEGGVTGDVVDNDTPSMQEDTATPPGPGDVTLDTVPAAEEIFVGESVQITCTVDPAKFATYGTSVTLVSGDDNAVTIADGTVTIAAEGVYEFACALNGTDVVDETPARVHAGVPGPSSVETEVAPSPIIAGETATVTCSAELPDGSPADVHLTVDVIPAQGWSLDGDQLTVTAAGDYEIACAAGDLVDNTPARLTVRAGDLARVAAQLDPAEVVAGESTAASCRAMDAYGNLVSGHTFFLQSDEDVVIAGADVSSTVAGDHEVTCVWQDGDDTSIDHESAELSVSAGAPEALTLRAVPDKATYRVGNQVTIERQAVDAFGNIVPEPHVTEVAADPEGGVVRLDDDAFRFAEEGVFTFSAALVDTPELSAEITLFCDGQGPAVVVDYPLRGATIDGGTTVNVTGTVVDQVSGVESFTINGEAVTLAADGSFVFPIEAEHGMNIIETVATDTAGQVEHSWRSFYYSDAWYPMVTTDPEGSSVANAALLWVDETVVDNPDPSAPDAMDLIMPIVENLDINEMIPSPAASQGVLHCDYDIYINSLSYGTPQVSLDMFGGNPGGIEAILTLPNLRIDIDAIGDGFGCVDLENTIVTADFIRINMDVFLQVETDGTVAASVAMNPDEDVHIENLYIDVSDWFNWLINLFEGTIRDLVAGELANVIQEEVADLVTSMQDVLQFNEDLPLGPLVGEGAPVLLQMNLGLGSLTFEDTGVHASLKGSIMSERVLSAAPLGSIGRGSCAGGVLGIYELPRADLLEAAIYDDILNQALFSFWTGGGLEISLSAEELAELGMEEGSVPMVSNLSIETHLLLPPILDGCPDDGRVYAQLGDAYVTANLDFMNEPVELGMYIQLAMDAEIVLADPEEGSPEGTPMEIGILLGELRTFEVEVVEINEEQAGNEQTFADLLKSVVPTLLEDYTDEPITFAIPSFDISEFSDDLTEPMWLTLAPETLVRELGFTSMTGQLITGSAPEEEPEPTVE